MSQGRIHGPLRLFGGDHAAGDDPLLVRVEVNKMAQLHEEFDGRIAFTSVGPTSLGTLRAEVAKAFR